MISQFQIDWRVSRNESKISVFIFNAKMMHENWEWKMTFSSGVAMELKID